MKPFSKLIDNEKSFIEAKNKFYAGNPVAFKYCGYVLFSQIVAGFHKSQSVIVTAGDSQSLKFYDDLLSYDENVFMLKEKDAFFDKLSIKSTENIGNRLSVLSKLSYKNDMILIVPISAFLDMYPVPESFYENTLSIKKGDFIDINLLEKNLMKLGYERATVTGLKGQYSVRGGIVDIYPVNSDMPVRIDFFDDEIETICLFDYDTQRSEREIDDIKIVEYMNTSYENDESSDSESELSSSLTDYLSQDATIFFYEPNLIESALDDLYKEAKCFSRAVPDKKGLFSSFKEFNKIYAGNLEISVKTMLFGKNTVFSNEDVFYIATNSTAGYRSSLSSFFDGVKEYVNDGYAVLVFINNANKAKRIAADLSLNNCNAYFLEDGSLPSKKSVAFYEAYLSEGIEFRDSKYVIITDNDIFGKRKRHKKSSKKEFKSVAEYFDLKTGDLVIHEDYGLGRYKGVEKVEMGGAVNDYLKIEYADNSNLYVPVTRMEKLQKYTSADNVGRVIRLDDIDGKKWRNTKAKAEKNVKETAEKLIKLYALRSQRKGFAYSDDTVWQREFEEAFEYEETPSQLSAINDVKRDMCSERVMDRLICGDVGFGKTEIALRASFKAVQENKQVAYLVPTTVLAVQHFKTFQKRLEPYPINVELLCRFKTKSEQKKTVEKLKDGSADIVIATHRLLSKDIKFKDLGLLIVDEEQRFGVSHKEKIKELKENIDVLTLTATPIPRTLNMSMMGVRDISVLKEAPSDRLPINTYALPYDENLIATAIKKEMARGGQVFFVYNRVDTIEETARKLSYLVPEAIIAYAHGQMSSAELEKIMYDFENKKIDVLVTTTIIETGIDMPNVNTMIISDASKLGLSSLYQLRGRIGRSDRSSYAYMLYPKGVVLKEDAGKRLSSIKEFSALGSGYKIAMKDLEIRGEGNIFGFEQSGHIGAVGYELYCRMLKTAIAELKNEPVIKNSYFTGIDCAISAYIPNEYVEDEQSRMSLYRKIAMIETEQDRCSIEEELIDRFGSIPSVVTNLLKIAQFKAYAHSNYITLIKQEDDNIKFMLYEKADIDVNKIEKVLLEYNLQLAVEEDKDNPKLFSEGRYEYRHKYYGTLSAVFSEKPYFIHKLPKKRTADDKLLEIIEKVIDYVSLTVIK